MTERELNQLLMEAFPELHDELEAYMEEDGDGWIRGASSHTRTFCTPTLNRQSKMVTRRFSSGSAATQKGCLHHPKASNGLQAENRALGKHGAFPTHKAKYACSQLRTGTGYWCVAEAGIS